MINMENKRLANAAIDAYGPSLLARHTHGHEKRHLESTYVHDYVNQRPELIAQPKSEEEQKREFESTTVNNSFAFRKMVSQFTDLDGPKREGINTFHIQHGEYPNQVVKNQFRAKNQNNLFNA
jgi:hypothetical protein